jgi:hypothetical protein
MNFEEHLDSLVPLLSKLKFDPMAEVFHELMSDALVWTDEQIQGLTVEQMGCLRALLRYRTSLIVETPDTRFERLWKLLKVKYPKWIGFTSFRCTPSKGLQDIYRSSKRTK